MPQTPAVIKSYKMPPVRRLTGRPLALCHLLDARPRAVSACRTVALSRPPRHFPRRVLPVSVNFYKIAMVLVRHFTSFYNVL